MRAFAQPAVHDRTRRWRCGCCSLVITVSSAGPNGQPPERSNLADVISEISRVGDIKDAIHKARVAVSSSDRG